MTVDRRYATDLIVEAKFPSIGGSCRVYQAEVLRQDRAMDSASIDFFPPIGSEMWVDDLQTGTPVLLTWRSNNRRGSFEGYVHSVEASNDQRISLKCVGMGYPLHMVRAKARSDTTSRDVIASVSTDYMLEFSTNPSGTQRWNITQAGGTDWDWLLKVTLREGLSLHFRGACLLAQPLDYIRDRNFRAPFDVVIPKAGLDRVVSQSQSPVRSFKNRSTKIVRGAFAQTQNAYGMISSGQVANVVTSGLNNSTRFTMDPVSSPMEAQMTYSQRDIQERWTNRAHLEMDGIPNMYPLDLVRTGKEGIRELDAVWSVLSIRHVLTRNDYLIRVELGQETTAEQDLLQRPIHHVEPTYRLHRQTIGSNEWYVTPQLRLRGTPIYGLPGISSDKNWYWTAERVTTR